MCFYWDPTQLVPPDPLQRAGNYWEGRGRSPQRPGLFPLPLTSRFSSRSDCWRGKADCTDRGRWSPWAQPAHKQSTAALQLQIRQVSPELHVKKKKKMRGKKKRKKGKHNPGSALAKPGPFKERKFPRATLDKPRGPILLSGMSVQI